MNLKGVPPHVRVHMYITWAGMALGALGILGFFLSFNSVGSPAQALEDVHRDIPWGAYISIFMWVGGLLLAWYGRIMLNKAVRKRTQELADSAVVELD
ncbi:MAG: hypothetical protein Q8S43_00865 [Actinomycetota bacterium]|nr:MAG: hypothetical protein FD171_96 [Actinomycetota bacterium]MDO8950652.1 hypothetical protein [Actinomycetota bacterium]MDP3629490.1 hypothetical protein [Actinomycetota bacterium]